jgi:hypothetical protein
MSIEEIEIVQVWDNFREHYYCPPTNPKYKHLPVKKVPKEIFDSYLYHREQMFHYYTLLREYFAPIREQKMHVAKNHERFNYETLEFEPID